MILADKTIKKEIQEGRIKIEPFDKSMLKPASVYLRLSNQFRVFKNSFFSHLETKNPVEELMELMTLKKGQLFIIHPGDFVLGSTLEKITIPSDMTARLHGRSGLGRLGIIIHATAGGINPGWSGNLTFEIANLSKVPVAMPVGMKVAQVAFVKLSSEAKNPYGSRKLRSKYQDQTGPTASQFYRDFLNH
jgi:dCTP deaminase